MKTIIAATDFSSLSNNAVRYAAKLAMTLEARLVLYHDVETQPTLTESPMLTIGEYYADDAYVQLESAKEELMAYTNNSIDIKVKLRWGNAAIEMNQLSYEEKPFAIVMAATQKTSIDRILTGSRTLSISHQCKTPLLLIPEGASFTGFNTISIATDFDNVVDSMPLLSLTHWIKHFKTNLEIVHVSPNNQIRGEQSAEAMAIETHFKEFVPQFHYITNNNAAAGIDEYVKKHKPDLLILVPKKQGWFHKSLCKQLILHPSSALLIVPNQLQDCNCL